MLSGDANSTIVHRASSFYRKNNLAVSLVSTSVHQRRPLIRHNSGIYLMHITKWSILRASGVKILNTVHIFLSCASSIQKLIFSLPPAKRSDGSTPPCSALGRDLQRSNIANCIHLTCDIQFTQCAGRVLGLRILLGHNYFTPCVSASDFLSADKLPGIAFPEKHHPSGLTTWSTRTDFGIITYGQLPPSRVASCLPQHFAHHKIHQFSLLLSMWSIFLIWAWIRCSCAAAMRAVSRFWYEGASG